MFREFLTNRDRESGMLKHRELNLHKTKEESHTNPKKKANSQVECSWTLKLIRLKLAAAKRERALIHSSLSVWAFVAIVLAS
jgi:hypothetical protein